MTRKGPILNYTTSVDATKTAGEIQELLRRHGARRVAVDYGRDGEPEAVLFEVQTRFGVRGFWLPSRVDGVLAVLGRNVGKGKLTRSMVNRRHATNVAWRILRDGIEVQLAYVDAGLASFEEQLLAHMLQGPDGRTMFEFIEEQLALPRPDGGTG